LAEPLIEAGVRSKGVTLCGKAEKLIEFDVSELRGETRFPLSIYIPQEDVERIFREKLDSEGIPLFRNKRVVGMGHSVVSPGVEVQFEDGSAIRAQYVVGADGARSTVTICSSIHAHASF
jgi:2-polyprenyl-6-methoxyphenol hydroxylase-like FAD-dependent oxidoreductase